MSHDWRNAAERYRRARVKQENGSAVADDQQRRLEVQKAVIELQNFMAQEGGPAMELLRESRRHIILTEMREDGGFGCVYFLDGNGLQRSHEAMGMWVIYSQSVPKPTVTPVTAEETVRAVEMHGDNKIEEIVSRIRNQLNDIAKSAPNF